MGMSLLLFCFQSKPSSWRMCFPAHSALPGPFIVHTASCTASAGAEGQSLMERENFLGADVYACENECASGFLFHNIIDILGILNKKWESLSFLPIRQYCLGLKIANKRGSSFQDFV